MIQKHPVCLHPMCRHESQRQTHKHRNNASPIPKEQAPQKAVDLRRKRQPPTTRQRASGGGTPQAQKTTRQTRRGRSEDKARGETRRRETLIETQAPDHTATTVPRRSKRGDDHSPMKHSKRRMLGTYDRGRRHAPICSRPASRRTTSSNSRKSARGEQKCEKCRRLYSAEM